MAEYNPEASGEVALRNRRRIAAATQFIASIDWKVLQSQKQYLADVEDYYKLTSGEGHSTEQGILNLLDALTDLAVDHFGVPSETVFPTEL